MLSVLDRLSLPGSPTHPNEDACGVAGPWAWVIDGAVLPDTPPVLHETSDAAWLAAFASERFAARASEAGDGPALIGQVIEDAMMAFLAAAGEARRDPATWPLAALTLVRVSGDRLDAWTLGDTGAYVRDRSGACRILGEAAALRRAESARAAELMRLTGLGPDDIARTPAFRAALIRLSRGAGLSESASLADLQSAARERLRHDAVPIAPPATILLTTDGFSALTAFYGAMDPDTLVEAACVSGLAALARDLRRIETEADPDARRFPRFKRSDDATALLLATGGP